MDLDGDSSADDPWDFGGASQYPALKISSITPAAQRALIADISARPPTVYSAIGDATIVNESGTKQVSLSSCIQRRPRRRADHHRRIIG